LQWFETEDFVGEVHTDLHEHISLMSLNDAHKWTFDQIADALEKTYLPEDVRA
jgi:hypothetical protein